MGGGRVRIHNAIGLINNFTSWKSPSSIDRTNRGCGGVSNGLWGVYDNLGTFRKIIMLAKSSLDYSKLWRINPEVLLTLHKTFVYENKEKFSVQYFYDEIKKDLDVERPSFTKNLVLFNSKKSNTTFEIRVHRDIKHITVDSKNYVFFPFRNQNRIKFLSEDFKTINTSILNKLNCLKRNELLKCTVKIQKIKKNDKIEFIFDDCIIISKNNEIQINKVENKNYENLIKTVIIQWFKRVM